MKKQTLCGFLLLLFFGCNNQPEQKQQRELTYFDITGYFETEVARLSKANPSISKTVAVNGGLEEKQLRIADWKKELSSFSNADINRASWKGAFTLSRQQNTQTYTSDQEKIPVKKVQVSFEKERLKSLLIVIRNSNSLYRSEDTLTYYPDSLYRVQKTQKIKLLNEKNYVITGTF